MRTSIGPDVNCTFSESPSVTLVTCPSSTGLSGVHPCSMDTPADDSTPRSLADPGTTADCDRHHIHPATATTAAHATAIATAGHRDFGCLADESSKRISPLRSSQRSRFSRM
jgi:hypothetical protein